MCKTNTELYGETKASLQSPQPPKTSHKLNEWNDDAKQHSSENTTQENVELQQQYRLGEFRNTSVEEGRSENSYVYLERF